MRWTDALGRVRAQGRCYIVTRRVFWSGMVLVVNGGGEDPEGVQQTVGLVLIDTSRRLVDRVLLLADACSARERRSEPQPPVETVSRTGRYDGVARGRNITGDGVVCIIVGRCPS